MYCLSCLDGITFQLERLLMDKLQKSVSVQIPDVFTAKLST